MTKGGRGVQKGHFCDDVICECSLNPKINDSVTGFGYQSECASHHPNARDIWMRKPSKILGGYRLFLKCLTKSFDSNLIVRTYSSIISCDSYSQKRIHSSVYWKFRKYAIFSFQHFSAIVLYKFLWLGHMKLIYPKYPWLKGIFNICNFKEMVEGNAFC